MSVRPLALHTGRLILAIGVASLALATPAHAQRRIEGQRYGGGPLYRNPAGHALGSGSVNTPDGILGQNAMGAGDALDSNLQVGSGGRNFRRSSGYSYQAIQARNLVVTNGVAGGRGFRGDVGYYAPGDFNAPTGDTNYGFRRDSALSGLDFVSSTQQRDAFNIAQGVGVFQYRRDFTSLPEVNTVDAASRIDDAQIRLDRATTALQTGNLLTTAVAPADIGYVQISADQLSRVTASPIRGIQYESPDPAAPRDIYDMALFNDAMIQEQEPMQLGLAPQTFDVAREVTEALSGDPLVARIESPASGESAYLEILKRIHREYEGRDDIELDVTGLERMRQDFGRLDGRVDRPRRGLEENDREDGSDDSKPKSGLDVGPADGEETMDAPQGAGGAGSQPADGAETEEKTDDEERNVRTPDELIDALSHRSQVSELVDPRMRARVAEIVGQAEAAMRDRDYFRAEDRFDLALKLNPGNPMLEAGRANAQIGAGLYRSAAVTLLGLFRKHESMIDTGFDAGLLPSRTRLLLAAQTIEGIVAKDPDGSSGLGLVVGYIGRQLGDRAMIKRGLDSIDDARVTPIVRTLEGVWLSSKPIPTDIDAAVDGE